MPTSMPISLVIAWMLLFGFVNTHQRHAMGFKGESGSYLSALKASVVLGALIGLGLLFYYFTKMAWYWPLVLLVIGSVSGGLLFGVLDNVLGQLTTSLVAFVGWPVSAFWAYLIISGLRN